MQTIDNYDAALGVALEIHNGDELVAIADLWQWSSNYDRTQTNPFGVFMALTGIDRDLYGESYTTKFDLDFAACDYVADALKLWATRPNDVRNVVDALLGGESDDD